MIFLPIFNESTEKALKKIKIFDNLPFLLPIYQQSREEKRGGALIGGGGDKWRKYGIYSLKGQKSGQRANFRPKSTF